MKKSKVVMTMAIAIIAIVAVCSVSFAAWSITKVDQSGIEVTIAKPVELKATHSIDGSSGDAMLIPKGDTASFEGNTVEAYITGKITASLANTQEGTAKKIYVYATATVGGEANTDLVIKIDTVAKALTFTDTDAIVIDALDAKAMTVELPEDTSTTVEDKAAFKTKYAGKKIAITLHFLVK